jgi:hypothetical protein
MWIFIRNNAFFLANLRICGLGRQEYLRIYHYTFEDLLFADGIPQKFADLRIADESLRICGCAICGLAYLRNFAHLRLRNELNNLRICDLRTNQNNYVPTSGLFHTDLHRKHKKNQSVGASPCVCHKARDLLR